jgi:hemolysin activation/secretion protein
MLDTKCPTSSVFTDALRCLVIVVVTSIFMPGFSITSALAVADVTPQPLSSGQEGAPAVKREVPATTKMPVFDIFEYRVDGNSLLPGFKVENALSPFMGRDKTLHDVEGARTALERAYHDAGYMTVVVSIPEQRVDEGSVVLHVVEASIGRLLVKGGEYTPPSKIKSRVPELAEGKVPNFNTVQAELTTLNRDPNVKVTPILRAGQKPGTVEVQLDVVDQFPLHGSLEFSNRQSPNTTPQRLSASLRYDNLWQRGHSFGLTTQIAPERPSDARVAAGTYVLPVNSAGDSLTIYAVHSRSQFASLAGAPGLGLLGNTDTIGTRYSPLLPGTDDYLQTFSFGLDYKNVKQTLVLQGGGNSDSPISYVPLVATYTGNLFSQSRSTILDVTTTSGLRSFFGNNDAEFNTKRNGASSSFLVLHGDLQHTENIFRWALFGKFEKQMSSGTLVPTEQFIAGGAESVRGYLEGERAGDSGMRATVELHTPQMNFGNFGSAWHFAGLVFSDWARLSDHPQPGNPPQKVKKLHGEGFGFRFATPRGLTIDVDAARAMRNGDITRTGKKRVHARALWAF